MIPERGSGADGFGTRHAQYRSCQNIYKNAELHFKNQVKAHTICMTVQTVASITITQDCLPSPAICTDILFESHLHAGDEVAVPYGVEDAVAKFESKKILDNFFGKEVVYAIPVACIIRAACP
jgi:hypothetical protein